MIYYCVCKLEVLYEIMSTFRLDSYDFAAVGLYFAAIIATGFYVSWIISSSLTLTAIQVSFKYGGS